MRVKIVGNSKSISLGVKRYSDGLKSCLQERGVNLVQDEPEIIHAVSHWHCPAQILFAQKLPFVVSVGDIAPISRWNGGVVDYSSLPPKIYARLFKVISDRVFNHADRILAISSQTLEEIKTFYPRYEEKVEMVKPCIDPKFRPQNRKFSETVRIGYYRGIRHGLHKVIDRLNEKKIGFSLCNMTGTSEESIVDYYNNLDYYVDLSLYRGFGYPIVEARACGAQSIVRRDAKIPAEVKKLCIQVDDEVDAARQIENRSSLPNNPLPFTMQRMAANILAIYEELL